MRKAHTLLITKLLFKIVVSFEILISDVSHIFYLVPFILITFYLEM